MAEQAVPSEDQLKAPTQPIGSFTERAIDIGALEEVDGGKKSKRSSETKIIQDGEYRTLYVCSGYCTCTQTVAFSAFYVHV